MLIRKLNYAFMSSRPRKQIYIVSCKLVLVMCLYAEKRNAGTGIISPLENIITKQSVWCTMLKYYAF